MAAGTENPYDRNGSAATPADGSTLGCSPVSNRYRRSVSTSFSPAQVGIALRIVMRVCRTILTCDLFLGKAHYVRRNRNAFIDRVAVDGRRLRSHYDAKDIRFADLDTIGREGAFCFAGSARACQS